MFVYDPPWLNQNCYIKTNIYIYIFQCTKGQFILEYARASVTKDHSTNPWMVTSGKHVLGLLVGSCFDLRTNLVSIRGFMSDGSPLMKTGKLFG